MIWGPHSDLDPRKLYPLPPSLRPWLYIHFLTDSRHSNTSFIAWRLVDLYSCRAPRGRGTEAWSCRVLGRAQCASNPLGPRATEQQCSDDEERRRGTAPWCGDEEFVHRRQKQEGQKSEFVCLKWCKHSCFVSVALTQRRRHGGLWWLYPPKLKYETL